MSPSVPVLLLLAACAGPSLHRAPLTADAEAPRPVVASTLAPADPLAAPSCGLPMVPCAETASSAEPEEHHHHPVAAPQDPAPAPAAPPMPEEHRHHHPVAAPPNPAPPKPEAHRHHHDTPKAAPESSTRAVIDPVCGMKLEPSAAKGGTLTLHGTQHWFCSSSCRRTFLTQHPEAK